MIHLVAPEFQPNLPNFTYCLPNHTAQPPLLSAEQQVPPVSGESDENGRNNVIDGGIGRRRSIVAAPLPCSRNPVERARQCHGRQAEPLLPLISCPIRPT